MGWWQKLFGLDQAARQQAKLAKRSKDAMPTNKEVSGKCDICNQPASTTKGGKVFTAKEMRRATDHGFNAYATGGPARMLAMGGFGKDEAFGLWEHDVMRDATDWLLCPRCQSKIRRYL